MSTKYFHLTLGPVQGFVAQARRSRDFWAGSFILSYLSGVAILSVKKQQGEIKFPIPDDNFLEAIQKGNDANHIPMQGGIPNRFTTEGIKVEVSNNFDPNIVVDDIKAAFTAIADTVYENDIHPFCQYSSYNAQDIADIWDKQIDNFWDVSWVLTTDEKTTNLLDRRKNWRSHYQAKEYGSKCMMMDGYQELSGTVKANIAKSAKFWQDLRNDKSLKHIKTDLNEGEQLCALAFVKRRFAWHFSQLNSKLPSGLHIKGWQFNKSADKNSPLHVPSLPYLAAMPFIEKALTKDKCAAHAVDFIQSSEAAFGLPSSHVKFYHLKNAKSKIPQLDGLSFYPDIMQSDHSFKQSDTVQQKKIKATAKSFSQFKNKLKIQSPSPFYALLLMDGDSLGKQMSDSDKQRDISHALNQFTKEVQQVIDKSNGFLIYSGGDDVLALLPLDYAISCATKVKECYDACFKGKKAFSTLSGAIQFAHFKTPLMKIIKNAHSLLDDVAKDQTGRNSLAIRIHKPGGLHAQWAMPWHFILKNNALPRIVELLQNDEPSMTNAWLMRAYDLLQRLTQQSSQQNKTSQGEIISGIDKEAIIALISQDYLHSGITLAGENKKEQAETAQKNIALLLEISEMRIRTLDNNNNARFDLIGYQSDAIKLVRFLATKGVQD